MLKIWTLLSFPMTMMFSQTGCSDPLVKYPIPHIGNITLLIFFLNPTITFVFFCNMGEEAATAEDMDMDQSRWIPFQYWGFCRWVITFIAFTCLFKPILVQLHLM